WMHGRGRFMEMHGLSRSRFRRARDFGKRISSVPFRRQLCHFFPLLSDVAFARRTSRRRLPLTAAVSSPSPCLLRAHRSACRDTVFFASVDLLFLPREYRTPRL